MRRIILISMGLIMLVGICFASTPPTKLHYWQTSQLIPVKNNSGEYGILFERACSMCGIVEVYFINVHHKEVKCPVRILDTDGDT